MSFGDGVQDIDAFLDASDKYVQRVKAKKGGLSKYVPHLPHPKQAEFLAITTQEALYGGAACGGKSDALLMAALQYVDVKGYNAIIFRRTFSDLMLPDAIMFRALEWLSGTDAHWDSKMYRFTFPSGATLSFGYIDNEQQKYRYQGAQFQFIAFDELTQFPEGWYRYLFSRLRKLAGSSIPLRMRSATNPGGLGHQWVKKRFIDPETREAPFVQALISDNPSADADTYRESLSKLDAVTRGQLERGEWNVDASRLVYHFEHDRNTIDLVPPCTRHVLGLDYGVVDDCSWTVMGYRSHDPNVYIKRSFKRKGVIPSENAKIVRELDDEYHFERMVGDAGGLGKGYVEEARRVYQLPIEEAEKQNKVGFIKLMNGALESGLIKVVARHCADLIAEWQDLPWADESRLKEAPGFPNHCSDGTLYAWRDSRAYLLVGGDEGVRTISSSYSY